MVSRRLLPIWRRLPDESTRVYRLQSDDGERVIGRRVSPAWAASVANDDGPVRLSGEEALSMLMSGEAVLHLAQDQKLPRVRAMHDWRIELTGFHAPGVEPPQASEIGRGSGGESVCQYVLICVGAFLTKNKK